MQYIVITEKVKQIIFDTLVANGVKVTLTVDGYIWVIRGIVFEVIAYQPDNICVIMWDDYDED